VGVWDHWLWLLGSLVLAVVVAQVTWWLEQSDDRPEWADRVLAWPHTPLLSLFLRFLFYVGVPFAALTLGSGDIVVGRWMGLQRLVTLRTLFGEPVSAAEIVASRADWIRDLGWTMGLGGASWAMMALGWRLSRSTSGGLPAVEQGASYRWPFLEAIFHEVHWAFYRNVPIVALVLYGDVPNGVYWGAWAGLALVILEMALDPRWTSDTTAPERAPRALTRAGLAVLSVVLFLQTQNLWLAILVHWAVTWGLEKVWGTASTA
jgi:hypothetical protein